MFMLRQDTGFLHIETAAQTVLFKLDFPSMVALPRERYNTCAAPRLRTHDCWPRMCKLNSSLFSLFKIVPLEKSGLDQRRGGVLIACTKTMFYCLRIISQQ